MTSPNAASIARASSWLVILSKKYGWPCENALNTALGDKFNVICAWLTLLFKVVIASTICCKFVLKVSWALWNGVWVFKRAVEASSKPLAVVFVIPDKSIDDSFKAFVAASNADCNAFATDCSVSFWSPVSLFRTEVLPDSLVQASFVNPTPLTLDSKSLTTVAYFVKTLGILLKTWLCKSLRLCKKALIAWPSEPSIWVLKVRAVSSVAVLKFCENFLIDWL